MQILAHRGFWLTPEEKNQEIAFRRALEHGFGIETDVRDAKGQLVISHDLPQENEMTFEAFLKLYKAYPCLSTLAINIKADGLQQELKRLLFLYEIDNYFVFDMSVPDGLGYLKAGLKTYTRQSEFEVIPLSFYQEASGVWLDCFLSDWIDEATLQQHLDTGKAIAIVSPELHKRLPYLSVWERYKSMPLFKSKEVFLCTDIPQEAKRIFND